MSAAINSNVQLLRTTENGTIRIRNTRITLDTLIACYQQGDTPEDIHKGFSTLSVEDIQAVIDYYLENRDTVDQYLAQQDAEAEAILQAIEANYTPEQHARLEHLSNLVAQKHDRNP